MNETTVYYPSDWLIHGGPAYEQMNCPTSEIAEDETFELRLVMDPLSEKWQILDKNTVLMESINKSEVIKYIMDYMIAAECWLMNEKDAR